jgi:histidinol phosphatase-like enzyme
VRVFENRVLRRIYGFNRDGIIEGRKKKIQSEKLHNFYFLPSVIRMIKSRRVRGTGHVVCMGEKRCAYRVLMGEPEGKTIRKT